MSPHGGVNSGRNVSTANSRVVGTCPRNSVSNSSVDGSAQCRSSQAYVIGCCLASAHSHATSASWVFSFCFWGLRVRAGKPSGMRQGEQCGKQRYHLSVGASSVPDAPLSFRSFSSGRIIWTEIAVSVADVQSPVATHCSAHTANSATPDTVRPRFLRSLGALPLTAICQCPARH